MGGGGFTSGMNNSIKNNAALRGRKLFNRDSFTPVPVHSKQKQLASRPQESFIEARQKRETDELKKLIGYLTVILLMFIVICSYLLYV